MIRTLATGLTTLAILLALTPAFAAQDATAQEILDNMTREVEATEDAAFLLTGRLVDSDGTSINLEVEFEVIPELEVARATFYQPDALADNVVVFRDDAIHNYLFLTNQVTIFAADDPDALGGLLPEGDDEGSFRFTLDLEELFAGWETTVEGYEDGAYMLRFVNVAPDAAITEAEVRVPESDWVPREIVLFTSDGRMLAEIHVEEYRSNTGLDPADVVWLPEDAEIIDERD